MALTKISKHISYKEATYSDTAIRKKIKNEPNNQQIEAMKILAKKVFEPARTHFDEPIRINSFFRSIALNKRIGGSSTSQHCKGEAIDIDGMNGVTNKELFDYIKNNLEFDQLIWEFGTDKNPDWVHVSYTASKTNRNMILKAIKGGSPVYQIIGKGGVNQPEKPKTKRKVAKKKGVVKVKTSLNVRSNGSKEGNIIGKLNNGDKLTLMGKRKDWLKVKAGKIEGWVFEKYILRL